MRHCRPCQTMSLQCRLCRRRCCIDWSIRHSDVVNNATQVRPTTLSELFCLAKVGAVRKADATDACIHRRRRRGHLPPAQKKTPENIFGKICSYYCRSILYMYYIIYYIIRYIIIYYIWEGRRWPTLMWPTLTWPKLTDSQLTDFCVDCIWPTFCCIWPTRNEFWSD